ncbi:MAG: succinate dehydrogenase, hydrophobic membrane anchor protein [Betaproteobacteria bacterium]|nr:MAG: succinate dehydrogenase, hydrophobic membrane anchor protein [Betaproteobacteria bacterium]
MTRHAGGARSGLTIWLLQRASAVWMALITPVALWQVAGVTDYAAWLALFQPLYVKLIMLLTVIAVLVHAWIGLREVMMEYVQPMRLRLPLLFVFLAASLLCVGWAAHIVWVVV